MKVKCIETVLVDDKYLFIESKTYDGQLCVNDTAIKVRYTDDNSSKNILFPLNNSMVESFSDKPEFEKYFTIVEK